jgi:CRISPR-associated protein Cst1
MRDWYFNAGIVGFLSTITDGRPLDEIEGIEGLTVGDNFIEFEDEIFNGFAENFKKQAFLKFFNQAAYLNRLQNYLGELEKKKIRPKSIPKRISDIEKSPYQNFVKLLAVSLEDTKTQEELTQKLAEGMERIKELTSMGIFNRLNDSQEGRESIRNFIKIRLKGVCAHDKLKKYIEEIKNTDYSKKLKPNDLCPSCQKRKSKYEFSNSISNIIGFNKDNSNWTWAYKATHIKICPHCSLLYNCAFISFAYMLQKVEGNWQNFFYFLNHNSNLPELYSAVEMFKRELKHDKKNRPLYAMIKQTVSLVHSKQAESIHRNINFIELVDNPIMGGQGTKGYNVYNYNIDKSIAEFLYKYFSQDNFPGGYYKCKNTY